MDCWEGELVGFAICEQAADLVEFASELVSLISDQVESLAWDVWGVLHGAPVDSCESVAFEVLDASAGERAERAVEVAVDDELGGLVHLHELSFVLPVTRTIDVRYGGCVNASDPSTTDRTDATLDPRSDT